MWVDLLGSTTIPIDSLAVSSLRRRDSGGATEGSVDSSNVSADGAWLTLEPVVALFAAGEDSTLLLEFGHRDGRKGGSQVVFGCLVVNLMDLDDLVNDVRFDHVYIRESAAKTKIRVKACWIHTSVDHRYNNLPNVMMEMLASLDGHDLMSLLAFHVLGM